MDQPAPFSYSRGMLLTLAPSNRLPAIDNDSVANYEGCCIRTQPQNGRGDLFGTPHPSDRLLRDHRLPAFGSAAGEALNHQRINDSWANRVDADIRCRIVECRRLCETDHAVLCCNVRSPALEAFYTGA